MAVVVGVTTAAMIILQARVLSSLIVDVTTGVTSTAPRLLTTLAILVTARAGLAWLSEFFAFRSSARAKEELRDAVVARSIALGPVAAPAPAETATLVTRGVDALDAYYARYLPQLMLAVIVPLAILATMLGQDLLSTLIIAITIPLIPLFMILIGLYTRGRVDKQWKTLATLSGHFLDLIAGLPTLKAFGRAKSQATAIQAIGDRYRRTTMGVLRVSFLSSLALELLATLSVALVAVSVGLRLAEGQIAYSVALFVLLLAPEAYLPLRLVGQHFHAAAEGVGAAERVFAILETPLPAPVDRVDVGVRVENLTVVYPGRTHAALDPTSFTVAPGQVLAVVGRSGGGKSTLLRALLGFIPPQSGTLQIAGPVAWLPQEPALIATGDRSTVGAAVRLGKPDATDDEVRDSLARAGVDIDPDTVIADDGTGISVGQRRRVALARALILRAPVLLLDEPTAALDGVTEQVVVDAIRAEADRGAAVIVVAHRPALVEIADLVIRIDHQEPEESESLATVDVQVGGDGW